jgi:hypothetical protein
LTVEFCSDILFFDSKSTEKPSGTFAPR